MIRKLTANEKSINTNSDYVFERNGYKTWLDENHFLQLKSECNNIEADEIKVKQIIIPTFWERLKNFIGNVQVNDCASEEEKQMIIKICDGWINSILK